MADTVVTQLKPASATADMLIHVKPAIAASANVNAEAYRLMQNHAANDPDHFWAEQAKRIAWIRAPTVIKNTSFEGDVAIKWFEDGRLNASAVCLDAHLAERGDQTAIIWEGDDPAASKHITYRALYEQVCRLANVLKSFGVQKGDRVTIYLPMVPEAAVAMLACARVGAIHSIVFGGFSPDSLANRIQDCGSTLLICADEGRRGGRIVALKTNADAALETCPTVQNVIVVPVTGGTVPGRPRPRLRGPDGGRRTRMPAGADGRRRPAIHPVHQRQHRQAEGRAAYHRRLSGLGQFHP
jgi:acetyl-CoA synthetase